MVWPALMPPEVSIVALARVAACVTVTSYAPGCVASVLFWRVIVPLSPD